MASGLRYQTGREMPPGMQELYGVKVAGRLAMESSYAPVPECPVVGQNEPAADEQEEIKMTDEELITELRARAETVGADIRWLIDELIKRYRICKFEIETKKGV